MVDVPFKEMATSLWATIIQAGAMTSLLAYNYFTETTFHPIILYMVWIMLLVIIFAQAVSFDNLSKLAGFEAPYPFFNFFLIIFGIGFGGLVFSLVSYKAMQMFAGGFVFFGLEITSGMVYSMARPLYVPLSSAKEGIMFSMTGGMPIIILQSWVGFTEELQKIFHFKNITNWIVDKGASMETASFIAFIGTNVIFGVMHFFAYNGEIMSLVMAVLFGIVFWSTYIIPDQTNILTPRKPMEWQGVLLAGSVAAHATWNYLTYAGLPLEFTQFIIVCLALIGSSSVFMFLISRGHFDFVRFVEE